MVRAVVLVLGVAVACTGAAPAPVATLAADPFPVVIAAGAQCTDGLDVPIAETNSHVETIEEIDNVTTDPPTSGKHFGDWAQARIYGDPVGDGLQIHNLEHGHVLVQYRDIGDEAVQQLRDVVGEDPKMIVMAPRPTMRWVLALTSWGKMQVCDEVPADAASMVRSFIAANRDHAPESIE
jgi:hypothetical protein